MTSIDFALVGLWTGFLASAVVAWPVFRMLLRMRSRQTISQYAPESHQAKQGTPTMGGLIVVKGFLIGCAVLAFWPWSAVDLGSDHRSRVEMLLSPIVLAVGFALIGFLDDFVVPRIWKDKRGLGWKQKILLQFVFCAVSLFLDSRLRTPIPMTLGLFTVLFFSNAYNFSDGLDGLSGTLGVLLCASLVCLGMLTGSAMVVAVGACLGAALIPFLALNAPPAKVFMGDVGSLPIGAVIGYLVLDLGSSSLNLVGLLPLAILSLLMVAELVPVPMQIFWVKVFKKRLFPYTPIHHAFEKRGWPESRVVWLFGLTQLVLGLASVTTSLLLRESSR